MKKSIKTIIEASELKKGEEFIVKSLLGEMPVRFIEKNENEVIGGYIWKDGNEEIVRICKYSSGSRGRITIASYKNIKKDEINYKKFYKFLK